MSLTEKEQSLLALLTERSNYPMSVHEITSYHSSLSVKPRLPDGQTKVDLDLLRSLQTKGKIILKHSYRSNTWDIFVNKDDIQLPPEQEKLLELFIERSDSPIWLRKLSPEFFSTTPDMPPEYKHADIDVLRLLEHYEFLRLQQKSNDEYLIILNKDLIQYYFQHYKS